VSLVPAVRGTLFAAMYKCSECEREINQASEICPYCGADLAALLAAAASAEPPRPRSLPQLLLIWVGVTAVVALGLYLFVWFILPEYSATAPPKRAEAQAVEALRTLQATLSAYAAAEGGRYPATLEPLGEPAQAAARIALEAGYTLHYAPGATGDDGAVRTYALTAQPSRYGLRNYYTDQAAVIRWTPDNRPASASDPTL
jgi:hypothetical protein